MNIRRISFLTTIALCAAAILLSGPSASAAAKVIGILQVNPPALNVKLNGQPAAPGAVVHEGDLVDTGGNSAVLNLYSGQCVQVYPNTRGRIYDSSDATTFVATRGGFRLLHPGRHRHDDDPLHLPDGGILPGGGTLPGGLVDENGLEGFAPLGSFSFGNFSGTSVGGGSSSSGGTVTKVIPGLGIGVFDLFGTFIRFL